MFKNDIKSSDLIQSGIVYVAKISLWESQSDLIDEIYNWSELQSHLMEIFTTQYENIPQILSHREIIFAFFLTKKSRKLFVQKLPDRWKQYLEIEDFNPHIFDYYSIARSGKYVTKYNPN